MEKINGINKIKKIIRIIMLVVIALIAIYAIFPVIFSFPMIIVLSYASIRISPAALIKSAVAFYCA